MITNFLFMKKRFEELLVLSVLVVPFFCRADLSVDKPMLQTPVKPISLLFSDHDISGSFLSQMKGREISFVITFTADEPRILHKPWKWSEDRAVYEVGSELEDAVKFFVFEDKADVTFADVWVWRAGRTDGVGYADDMFWRPDKRTGYSKVTLTEEGVGSDAGRLCWYSRFLGSFVGDSVKRFYNRVPTGSCADVTAKGEWSDGQWRVTFNRSLTTLQKDDVQFRRGSSYIAVIAVRNHNSGEFTASKQLVFNLNGGRK